MSETDAGALAREWREARQAVLDLAERLPETRAYKNTTRAGWTLKHELSHLAALDDEVVHLLRSALEGGDGVPVHLDGPALRRLRGQAMHLAQEMRLTPLRVHLAAAGEAAARAIEDDAGPLDASVAATVRARLGRARESIEVFREHVGT